MSSEDYTRVLLTGVARAQEDELSSFCFEQGAQGVVENLSFAQPELRYDPRVLESDSCELNVYFSEAPTPEFFALLKIHFPNVEALATTEPSKDWLEEWKKGFEPFEFAHPFWIIPSWRQAPAQAQEKIFVDPGMAFGTGTHETTQLAARLLVKNWSQLLQKPKTALDVGTGTGILAIVAERLGSGHVVAVDIDPECRRVAGENIVANQCKCIELPEYNVEHVQEKFDLVIANIVDGVLLDLRSELLRCLKPGGSMVLSGILSEREADFSRQFASDLQIVDRSEAGEWVALVVKRSYA
jgi:ribosomal protein L11 methyltransferase